MNSNIFTRPDKPLLIDVKERELLGTPTFNEVEKPIILDASTNCFITPVAVSNRAVEYLNIEDNKSYLEPSAGNGNLIQALVNAGVKLENITAVELNIKLCSLLKNRFDMKVNQDCFLNYAKNTNSRFDFVLMNPPYSRNTALHHVKAAYSLLNSGGRLVAIVPSTFKHDDAYEIEFLPNDTFSGTKVSTKIIEIEKP